jgi:hypothetical protein
VLGPIITISTNHIRTTAGTAITPVTITNTGGDIYYYSISPALPNGLSFNIFIKIMIKKFTIAFKNNFVKVFYAPSKIQK